MANPEGQIDEFAAIVAANDLSDERFWEPYVEDPEVSLYVGYAFGEGVGTVIHQFYIKRTKDYLENRRGLQPHEAAHVLTLAVKNALDVKNE